MQKNLCALALAAAFAARAEDAVVVTGTPSGSSLFELVAPADLLSGRRLWWQRRSSLGETLDFLPGVSSTYFGPHSSRPVIRGLDGDRIRILQNGVGMLDASSLSFDHAVPYDPLAAERVEIVRGPAAVLYGGNAVGGVVNLIDNRVPSTPLQGFSGRIEPRAGGAGRERSLGAVLEAGNGAFALHTDGFDRSSRDLRIPGPARTVPNSDAAANGGTLGASATWDRGYLGMSYGGYRSNYGSPAEAAVRVDMRSNRLDLAGEARELGKVITGIKFKLGRTDYEHREIEDGAVNTTFRNRGHEGRLELAHGKLGPVSGAVGLQFGKSDFSALGAEAFVPATRTESNGLFLYEELLAGKWKFSLGARGEQTRVARFDPGLKRNFSTQSSAFGVLYGLTKEMALAANLSSTQRAPTYYELFANGPHVATGAFEVGDATFGKERSRSIDAGLRWRRGPHSASVSLYRTGFDNFIAAFNTGNLEGEDLLPEFRYRAVPALFRGFEATAKFRVYERAGALDLELKGDRVRATDRDSGQPLPRIAPTRIGVGLEYGRGGFTARADLLRAAPQNRVAANELPTDGYAMVNLALGYNFAFEKAALNAFLRVDNLLDREARNHVSFLKDRAPLGGRGVTLGLRGSF